MADDNISSYSDDFEDDDIESSSEISAEDKQALSDTKLKDLMNIEYTYPEPDDKDFQNKIFKKREFYYHKIPDRPEFKDYKTMHEYREKICKPDAFGLLPQQAFLGNFINPDTPYSGVLVMHGTGVGKCLLGDQYINTTMKKIKIQEIWDTFNTGVYLRENDGGEWSIPSKIINVDSLDNNFKRIISKIDKLYRQQINETVREVILVSGLSIKMTKQHKLLKKYNDDNLNWTNNYNINDKVYIYDDINNKNKYDIISEIREFSYCGYVYDLEIDTYHNYIANNIFTHNTCAGISIAERFKPLVQKYGTKIYVLVSGPIIKENWKDELLKCTGETYLKQNDSTVYTNEQDRQKARKNAINVALQYYRFMSYRSFYKKVLGEKIVEKVKTKDNKIKITYRKNEEGEFERDVAIDRIYNLNNSLIIADEAHNLTGNAYGEALMKVIRNSYNLKVVLLSATPMKNLADDILELINFIRPANDQIMRDKVFTSHKNHEMTFKPGGIDYLKEMSRGYISYLRGADPLTFAKRIDMGVVPPGLLFTKIVQCKMLPFQRKIYDEAIIVADDTLDRRSEAVANFAFPGLNDKKELVGYYGREGINTVRNQLKNQLEIINKKIATEILNDETLENDTDLLYISDGGKLITGKILKFEYLKNFSVKFYKALKKINRLVWGKKGSRTGFVYSNLVKVGIEIFQEILLMNGYLEYDENPNNYKIKPNTRCYFCGKTYLEHQQKNSQKINLEGGKTYNISDSSSDYEKKKGPIPEHDFHPATFVSVTGKSTEEAAEIIPEEKQYILRNVFSSIDNIDGKHIKLILGSKVMNEGLSLKYVAEVHILDVYFNLGKVDQVIGRAIRHCSHYHMMNEENPYPEVKVYKYAVTTGGELSSEEELYKKAELKYLLIKKVERVLKESAIDCPLNRSGNIFPEELEQFKNCKDPTEAKKGDVVCPPLCDYMDCNFKCDSNVLNKRYFDNEKNKYISHDKKSIDHSTFTQTLAKSEIETAKNKIKELYRIKYLYTLKDIINYVKSTYDGEKRELFDDFFVFEALNELTPITENDFNNFKDTIFDKYNRQGYLLYVDKYYIFQPFDQNENVPMYHRSIFDKPMQSNLTLYNYLKNVAKISISKTSKKKKEEIIDEKVGAIYNFDNVMEYYDNRDEYKYVGIIDKESSRKKTKSIDELADIFKIRERRPKILVKKRSTGLSSIFGSVCATSKDRNFLINIAKELDIVAKYEETRFDICEHIKERLLFLEKYSTSKKKNKFTYVMIPSNHPKYKFPYNLEDRKDYVINDIREKIKFKIDLNIKDIKTKLNGEGIITYVIEITNNENLKDFDTFLKSLGFELEGKKWIIKID
jgi:ABC-type lipoprotein export system ATPase subunit